MKKLIAIVCLTLCAMLHAPCCFAATNIYLNVTAATLNERVEQIPTNTANIATHTAIFAAGKTTNFTFMSATSVTGMVWFVSGVLTNVDLNIGD